MKLNVVLIYIKLLLILLYIIIISIFIKPTMILFMSLLISNILDNKNTEDLTLYLFDLAF